MKTKDKFYQEIQILDKLLQQRDKEFYNFDNIEIIKEILLYCDLPINDENIFAIRQSIGFLKNDLFLNLIKDIPFDKQQKYKNFLYKKISSLYSTSHQELISQIKNNDLLTPFYRYIIQEVHNIGISMTTLAIEWINHIQTIQKQLEDNIGDDTKIFAYLKNNNLFDKDKGKDTDRCYSVLIRENEKYKSYSYCDAFVNEVDEIISKLDNLINNLTKYKDEVFYQDNEFIEYFIAIKEALACKDTNTLVSKWIQVDIKWMALNSPIQIGHFLEYYEDKYRKSVAIEWDIRISTQNTIKDNISNDIKKLSTKIQNETQKSYTEIYDIMNKNLSNVQLYLGRPFIYYGTSFNGMFSAQVVPNDESVSKIYGKKIFAFGDAILEGIKAKEKMKIDHIIFEKDFLDKNYDFISNNDELWHKIYRISTIGHEYGHILWCDENSEIIKNKKGNFKNVEEFKATSGGLLSYFIKNDDTYYKQILIDTIKRAIKLLVYFKQEEIRPYYIEALIHLSILFDTKILTFDNKISVDMDIIKYQNLKNSYENIYKDLIYNIYLPQNEPTIFLDKYIHFDEKNIRYVPKDKKIQEFVLYYQDLYQEIGSQIYKDKGK
jgi:hypothetical protein